MAILNRRGSFSDFDKQKMKPGEWAVVLQNDPEVTDGKSVYMCFSAGTVKKMATYEDMVDNINKATGDVQSQFTEQVRQAIQQANSATSAANTATNKANTAATSANNAAAAANNVLESIEEAVQGTIINDNSPSSNTTYSGNKIDDMARVNLFNPQKATFERGTGTIDGNKITTVADSQNGIHYASILEDTLKHNTYYTISWKSTRTGETGGGIQVQGMNSESGADAKMLVGKISELNGHLTFNVEDYNTIRFYLMSGTADAKEGDSATFEVMLIEGTEYAPVLYNSRDIARLAATVDDRTLINLFDTSQGIALRGCTFEKSGNGFKLTATDMSSTPNARKDLEGLKPNTYYTIVAHSSRSGSSGGGIHVGGITSDAFTSINDQTSNLNPVVVFNSGEYERIRIAFSPCVTRNGNIGDTATYTDIMLVEGDYAPGEYVPYIGADTLSEAISALQSQIAALQMSTANAMMYALSDKTQAQMIDDETTLLLQEAQS